MPVRAPRLLATTIVLIAAVWLAGCDGEQLAFAERLRAIASAPFTGVQSGGGFLSEGRRSTRNRLARRFNRDEPELLAHRALYVVEVSGFSSTRFVAAEGTLTIDFTQNCEGWHLQEKLDVALTDLQGKVQVSNLLYGATELTSEPRFEFAYKRNHLGRTEVFQGHVSNERGPMLASFEAPNIPALELPPETIFPIRHLGEVLAAARAEQATAQAILFDGANDIPYVAVARIRPAIQPRDDNREIREVLELLERWSKDRLPDGRTWPVSIEFLPAGDPYAMPVVSREILLHESGVTTAVHLDFIDFQMDAKLAHLDILDPPACGETRRRR